MRKHLGSLLKISVTILGLGYVVWTVPLDQILEVLTHVQWFWVIVAFGMVLFSLVLRAYRWLLLIRGLGVAVHFGRLVVLYFVGNFFNAFLPSGFGGDAVRIFEIARDVPTNVATGTVIVDRMTGLMMLFLMALLALPFRPADFPDYLAWIIAFLSLAGIVGGFILLEGSLLRRFGARLPGPLSPVGDGPVAKVMQAVQGCGWRAITAAFAVSAIFNLILVGWWFVAGKALSFDIPYTYFLLVVPILSVALLVPSVSGLGVREWLAPTLFASAGLIEAEAVALSLLVFAIMRAASLVGGPVYIVSTIKRDRGLPA